MSNTEPGILPTRKCIASKHEKMLLIREMQIKNSEILIYIQVEW